MLKDWLEEFGSQSDIHVWNMNAVWTKIISKLVKKKYKWIYTVEQRCVEFISTNDAAKALIVYSIYLECYKCDVRYSDAGIC